MRDPPPRASGMEPLPSAPRPAMADAEPARDHEGRRMFDRDSPFPTRFLMADLRKRRPYAKDKLNPIISVDGPKLLIRPSEPAKVAPG